MPFLSDGVSADLGGYVGRRVDVGLTAGVAKGSGDRSASGTEYLSHYGSARVRAALSRFGALYVHYFNYNYRFERATQVTSGLPESLKRHGVRAGLTLWLPLLR